MKTDRITKYNLTIFLERAQLIHEDKFDYSGITENHIINASSRIPIKCKKCHYNWNPTITNHIKEKIIIPHNCLCAACYTIS